GTEPAIPIDQHQRPGRLPLSTICREVLRDLCGRGSTATQVLQEPQAIWGHGQAAPAAGGPVEHGPDQGEAAGLAGQPADDLDPAAGSPKVLSMKLECPMRLWGSAGNRR